MFRLKFRPEKLPAAIWKDWKIRSTSKSVLITQFLRYIIVFTMLIIFHEVNDLISYLFMRLLLPYALLMATQATIVDLASERTSGLRAFLRIHGLKDWISDFAKVTVEASQSAIIGFMFLSLFTYSSLLNDENSHIMALFIFLYLTSSAALSCFLVRFCPEANSAAGLVIWINAMAYLMFLAVESHEFLYIIFSAFPLTCFCQALWQITRDEAGNTQWGRYLNPADDLNIDNVPYWSLALTMFAQIAIYIFLASYQFRRNDEAKLYKDIHHSSLSECLLEEHTQQAVTVKGIRKSFGKFNAVKDVDLTVPKYGIFCLLGHNGAGKTTLLNLITGALRPDSGTISINKGGVWSPVQVGDFGYCPQHDIYIEGLTVFEQVQVMAKLRGKPKSSVMQAINLMGLGNKTQATFGDLSGGMKRRLTVAMADVGEPDVLILDEPTSGLDPETKGRLLQDLKDACKAKTVILTTHNMEEAEHLGDKISLMHRGAISNFNSSEDLKRQCQNCYFLQVDLDVVTEVREILDDLSLRPRSKHHGAGEKMIGSEKRRMVRIPLISSLSPAVLQKLFARLESRIPKGKVIFDSLSLQEAFVTLYTQKEGEQHEEATRAAHFDEVVRAANEIMNNQKISVEGRAWRQFCAVFMLRTLEVVRSVKNVLTFFFVPSIAIFDVTFRKLPKNLPLIDDSASSLFYTSGVWVVVTSLIITMSVYNATTHKTDRLNYWLRVNGVKTSVYWIAMVAFDVTSFILKFGFVMCGILLFNQDNVDKSNAIITIAPYQIVSAFPTIALMLLIFRNFKYKNIVQKAVFMTVYFGAYLSIYLAHLLVSFFDLDTVNVFLCGFGLLDPLWTGFYAPIKNTEFITLILKENPFITDFWTVALIQTVVGILCFTVMVRSENNRLEENRKNENENLATPPGHVIGAFGCSKKYGSRTVVNNLTLPIPQNHIQGFTGPNGAGKSTSFNLLSIEVPKNGGNVNYWTPEIDSLLFLQVGVCPQETTVWPELPLKDHLRLVAKIKGFKLTNEDIKKLLAAFGIEKSADVKAGELSGGNKRKLLILMSLMGNSKAKLLDEPTTGVDPVSRQVTWKMILSRKPSTGTLLSTHSMEEAEVLCDKVAIMSSGTKIEDDTPLNLREKFENSYELFVSLGSYEDSQQIRRDLHRVFPSCKETSDSSNSTIVFTLLRDEYFSLEKLFRVMAAYRTRGWGLKQSSFQNVFMSLLDQHNPHATVSI